jgi:hypothetical protein
MTLEEEMRFALDKFCEMKTAVCEREGGPQDLIPMLHFKYRHLNAYCGVVIKGNPIEILPMAWRHILDDGVPEFVMFMVEGYASNKISIEGYRRGEMESDFKSNPDSSVKEVITLQAVDVKTGEQMTAVVSYSYGDDGLPEFDEPNVGACEGEALNCNVPNIFKACREATMNFFDKVAR